LEKHKKYHVPALGGVSVAAQCRHDKAFGFWENWRPNACGAEPIYPERCLFAKYRVIRYVALGFGAWSLALGPWVWGLDFGLKLEKMVHSTGFEPVTSALGSIQVYKYN